MRNLSVIELKHDEQTSYRIFFLKDDADQSVEIIETHEIDIDALILNLRMGASVFITKH